ncbi:aryl hydrocarbon receptor nuclear translocator 2 isoform X1 [Culex quinquefasciatus]|uniref:aryl hydrocarbon receptor nuclear translocator 2 isoform X1 n=1 Tax=Culex quinquefasciatus TaxID=7176 RepID=UPI0018E296D8|nr:aryl hydrocarbon receptor nuclear translocator 2 isoform X1 [Culex quinquefasciatus]XP_038114602.1 aryl hydrocarbon receptor nuclear translocator 2 isoform X1 [Culex quinquefasciatus]
MSVSPGYTTLGDHHGSSRYYPHHHHHHQQPGPSYYGDDYPDNRYDPSSVGCYPMQQQPQQYNQNYPPPPMYSGPHDDRLSFPTAAGYHPGGPEGPSPGPQEIAMINHAGVSYGHQMPWYGGPPRAYPIPPGHMYNMYHFNRYDYEDSKAACKILNGREARNRAEKNRRDKLNGSIQELSGMVPHVAESPRRMDKTAVLRLSAHALRVDYVFGKTSPKPETKPVVVQQPEVQDTLFRMLNGFLLTVTCRGQIVLVSASVEQFLGHCQTDLYGQSLYGMVHPDDLALLKQQLVPTNLVNLFESSAPASSSSSSGSRSAESNEDLQKRSRDEEAEIDEKLRQDRRRFNLRIARAGPRSEPTAYEMVTVDGCFRRADAAPRGLKSSGPSGLQLLRRGRGGREDGISLHSINGNDIVLVAMVRVMKVPTICDRLIEACKYEYKTRHLIDGRIVQCDHRISVVAGYMTNEVSGLSPFTFMHKDDVRWVIVALRQMYDYNQPNGESCYRLMTRTGDFIYLKTRGYLEVDDSTKVVKSFVCINTLVSDEEGRRLVQEMKRKFSVIVDQKDLPDESDEPAVENQQQIEQAVMNLITNFHPSNEEDELRALPPAASPGGSSATGDGLAIIAPRPNAVKLSILKSMRVVTIASKRMSTSSCSEPDGEPNNTSAITQRPSVLQKTESRVPPLPSSDHYFTQPYSPAGSTSSSSSNSNSSILSPASAAAQQNLFQRNSRSPFGGSIPPPLSPPGGSGGPMASSASYVRGDNTASGHTRTASVLKRTYSNSSISSSEGSELKRSKASPSDLSACLSELVDPGADLTTLLPDAFDAVDQSLLTMESTTAIMRGQVGEYEELHGAQVHQHRLDKIAEEQQEHREMLQSIQQEFTLQIQSNGGGGGAAGGLAVAAAGGNGGPLRRIDPVIMRPECPTVNVPAAVAVTTSVITPNSNSTSSSQFYHRGADLSPS